MLENSQKKWVLKLAAESAAIVASILLAFSIEAWWADRQEHEEERRILLALKADFEGNLVQIEEQLAYRHESISSVMRMFEVSAGLTTLEPAEIDKLLGDVLWAGWADFSTGAMESLMQGGKLSIIENEQLRQNLAALRYWYANVAKMEDFEMGRMDRDIYPFLYDNSYLPQIVNTTEGLPGVGLNPNPSQLPTGVVWNHSELLDNPKFLGMLAIERGDHNDAIWVYGELKGRIERAIQIIDTELQDDN
jgi:hypothetical protein